MNLQLDEIVDHPDTDLVLRKLEPYFREVSLETARTDDQLLVSGLGPSFRTMNPRDKTVVRATSQPATTMLHIEASFLASALMGDVAQDDIVRSKIERVFECLKAELNLGTASHQPAAATPAATVPVVTMPDPPSPVAETAPVIATIAEAAAPAPVETEQISAAPVERVPDAAKTQSIEPEPKPEAELKPEAEPQPKNDEPVLAAPRGSAPVLSAVHMEAEPARKKRSAILFLLPILIVLLIAAGYFLQHPQLLQGLFPSTTATHTPSAPAAKKVAPPAPVATPAPPAPAATPKDIKAWIQVWVEAINTRDVPSQLAFYDTPLDRYFLASNVSKERLIKDKQAEIDDRKGVWTLKAEDIDVQKQTATNAVVVLIKDITAEVPGSPVRQERLKAQLKLKLVDGSWEITSERTIA